VNASVNDAAADTVMLPVVFDAVVVVGVLLLSESLLHPAATSPSAATATSIQIFVSLRTGATSKGRASQFETSGGKPPRSVEATRLRAAPGASCGGDPGFREGATSHPTLIISQDTRTRITPVSTDAMSPDRLVLPSSSNTTTIQDPTQTQN
jgi:hypothetical protein